MGNSSSILFVMLDNDGTAKTSVFSSNVYARCLYVHFLPHTVKGSLFLNIVCVIFRGQSEKSIEA